MNSYQVLALHFNLIGFVRGLEEAACGHAQLP